MISIDHARHHYQSISLSFIFFCCILSLLFGYKDNLLFAAQISGSVFLPGADTAPAGGIRVNIIFTDQQGGNDKVLSPITIISGQSSKQYSATLPNSQNALWIVSYYYWGPSYLQHGYYSSSGTTWKYSDATELTGGLSNINLTLLTGKTIAGDLSLPSGRTSPPAGKVFYINADDIAHIYGSTRVSCFLQPGQTSSSYQLTVPDDTRLRFKIFYNYYETDYLPKGYYSISGTKKNTAKASLLSGGQNYSNINMTVLPNFSWDIFLPAFIKKNHS